MLKEHARIGSISLREFYLRRAYRILPAAYTFMVVVIAAHWRALSWPNILTAVTYTSNYSHGGNWLLGHLWSLSVDEQFYLLWPLTLLLVFRRRLWIIADLVIAGPSLRVLFGMLWGHRGLEHPFPVVMDALAAGGALAMMQPYLRRYDHPLRQRQFLIVPCLTALDAADPVRQQLHLPGRRPDDPPSGHRAVDPTRGARSLSVLLSYSLYLWQQPFLNRGSTAWWTAFPLNLALALLCAAASHYLVERPFLALRERSRKEAKVVFPERVAMSGETLREDLASCVGRPSSPA